MQERFEVARSSNYVLGNAAVRVHVICREEQFYLDIPQEVRALGPWSVISRGEVSELAAEHRLTLARQGYVVMKPTCSALTQISQRMRRRR